MNILITGGAGFLGKHLVESLVASNNVTILDNFYSEAYKPKGNIVEGSICNVEALKEVVRGKDLVYHLAGVSSAGDANKDPQYCIEANIQGLINVLDVCRKHDVKLIFPSTIYVYGEANYLPIDELHPKTPKNIYAFSKMAGECYCEMFKRDYGLPITVLRLSNLYGSYDQRRATSIFIKRGLEGKEITIYGGKQLLDFLYIDDAVQAFLLASAKNAAVGETINIGSGYGTSLLTMAEKIVSLTGGKSSIKMEKQREYESQTLIADISKAKRVLNYEPKVSLEKGLELTVQWFKEIA